MRTSQLPSTPSSSTVRLREDHDLAVADIEHRHGVVRHQVPDDLALGALDWDGGGDLDERDLDLAALPVGTPPRTSAWNRSVAFRWLEDRDELGAYLRERYIDRGKHALHSNLAKVIVKGCIDPPESNFTIWVRHGQAADVLDAVAPDLLAEALEAVVGRGEAGAGLTDSNLVGSWGRSVT